MGVHPRRRARGRSSLYRILVFHDCKLPVSLARSTVISIPTQPMLEASRSYAWAFVSSERLSMGGFGCPRGGGAGMEPSCTSAATFGGVLQMAGQPGGKCAASEGVGQHAPRGHGDVLPGTSEPSDQKAHTRRTVENNPGGAKAAPQLWQAASTDREKAMARASPYL